MEHFGRAIFMAQQVEQSIVDLYLFSHVVPSNYSLIDDSQSWRDAIFSQTAQFYEKTLGGMIRAIQAIENLSPDVDFLLKAALVHRNHISHGFFRATYDGQNFHQPSDFNRYQQIEDAVVSFCKAGAAIEEITDSYRIRYGLEPMCAAQAFEIVQSYYDHAP